MVKSGMITDANAATTLENFFNVGREIITQAKEKNLDLDKKE